MTGCRCTDPECRECGGGCNESADLVVYRIDMEDNDGTSMCENCADDACRSGVFSTDPAET